MGQFKCGACGATYGDSGNITSCPICGGFGKPDKKCTCIHWCGFGGQRLNLIHTKKPDCPIHGDNAEIK